MKKDAIEDRTLPSSLLGRREALKRLTTLFGGTLSLPAIAGLLGGCDSILNPEPVGQVVIDNVYQDVDGTISGLNAAYAPMASGGAYNRAIPELVDLASDDTWTYRSEDQPKRFATDESNSLVQDLWDALFEGVARSNVVLAQVPGVEFPGDQASLKNAILGQARFLRALYYFHLVRFYGGVPLFTEPVSSPKEAAVSKAPTEEVYAQIEQDLTESSEMLPKKSELDGSRGLEEGRATSGAANALLAKAYLTQEKWTDAARAAKEVIDSGEYDLFSSYGDNFQGKNENGPESVLEVQYSSAGGPTGARHNVLFGPPELVRGNGRQRLIATDNSREFDYPGDNPLGIVQDFEEGDARKEVAMSNYGLPDFFNPASEKPRFYLVNKYFVGDAYSPGNSPVNYPVLRYAEVLLIRAEALNERGQSTEAAALANQVRSRAGLGPVSEGSASDQETLRKAIWKERRVELSFESKRFFDLNRTGRLAERMAAQGIEIDSAKIVEHPITGKPKYLYAIPLSETSTNGNITQNPGY